MSADVVHHRTLEAFFFEEIEQVQERTGKALPPDVEAYVVSLLARYASRTGEAGRRSRPIALDYLDARGQSGSARAHALRGVGDRALYISGVVPRSLMRTPVNVRYIRGIGESAYREVGGSGALGVLRELADKFAEIADVIGEMVELETTGDKAPDLLALYERWRAHGDPRDAKLLIRSGVIIDADGSDVLQ